MISMRRQAVLIITIALLLYACHSMDSTYTGWTKYKGSDACIQYSSLTQVDTTNVFLCSNKEDQCGGHYAIVILIC